MEERSECRASFDLPSTAGSKSHRRTSSLSNCASAGERCPQRRLRADSVDQVNDSVPGASSLPVLFSLVCQEDIRTIVPLRQQCVLLYASSPECDSSPRMPLGHWRSLHLFLLIFVAFFLGYASLLLVFLNLKIQKVHPLQALSLVALRYNKNDSNKLAHVVHGLLVCR